MFKSLQRKWKNKIRGYLKFNVKIKDKNLATWV